MIDLEEIKRHRALWTPEDSTSLPTICKHVDVLLAEVERLKNDKADIDHAYAFAQNKAMMLEREAVVAWLREDADILLQRSDRCCVRVEKLTKEIEHGKHRRLED